MPGYVQLTAPVQERDSVHQARAVAHVVAQEGGRCTSGKHALGSGTGPQANAAAAMSRSPASRIVRASTERSLLARHDTAREGRHRCTTPLRGQRHQAAA
jgi:hypothetical protein